MRDALIEDITNYIKHLNESGLFITVHGHSISGLIEHNIHKCPFCLLVKTDKDAWQKCIDCQKKVFSQYKCEKLFGMCHAGVEEYVFFVDEHTFISVSGYGINKEKATERIEKLSKDFFLKKNELLNVYDKSLNHEPEDFEKLTTIIKPLCHMVFLLQQLLTDIEEIKTKNNLYDAILGNIQSNFMENITIKDIANSCSCSESTVCHIFKQYKGVSVNKYLNELRIRQAKKLLKTSNLPISTIALMCGFTNINYFPTAFKKAEGISPKEYRIKSQ